MRVTLDAYKRISTVWYKLVVRTDIEQDGLSLSKVITTKEENCSDYRSIMNSKKEFSAKENKYGEL